jgi:hypothetical protein
LFRANTATNFIKNITPNFNNNQTLTFVFYNMPL